MDRIDLKKIVEEVVGLEEITVSQDIDIVDDHDEEWIEDRSKPEVEFDDEQHIRYAIDGDVDEYFFPGSGGKTYPH